MAGEDKEEEKEEAIGGKLNHREKKGPALTWFIFALIPIIKFYWLWKEAELISGHKKETSDSNETLSHKDRKSSTLEWFGIILAPTLLLIATLFIPVAGVAGTALVAFIVLRIYIFYRASIIVSAHEASYSGEEGTASHKSPRDLTIGWFLLRIIPVLNLYFLWKMSEIISGHETRPSEKQSIEEEGDKKKILAFVLPFVFLFIFFNLSTSTIQYKSIRGQIANGLGRSLLDEPADWTFFLAQFQTRTGRGAIANIIANTARAFQDPIEAFITEFAIPIDPLPIQLTPEARI